MVNIDLASFSFDTSEIIAGAALIKKSIDELKQEQSALAKQGDAASERYVQNAAGLKVLNAEYNNHIKFLSETTKGAFDAEIREKELELVLGQEATTINELREQNKQLNKLRNDTNILTDEGKEELKLLNEQLDRNNEKIKENVDQYTQQKIGIGDYASGIKSALAEMNPFNVSISVFIQNAQEAGGVLPLLKNGFKAVATGIQGMTRAAIAFIATPIGAVIAAVGLVLGAIVGYLKSTQSGMDAVTKVTRPLTAIFESLVGVLQQVGKWLFEAFSNPRKAWEAYVASFEKGYKLIKDVIINPFIALIENFVLKFQSGILKARIAWNEFTGDTEEAAKLKGELDDINAKVKENEEVVKKGAKEAAKAYNEVKEGIKGVGDFFDEAIKKGQELDRLQKELEQTQIDNKTLIGEAAEAFKQQNKDAEDTNKTLAQREEAVKESIKSAQEINRLKQKELDLEIAILKNKQSRNDTTRQEEAALAELLAKKNELNAQELEMTTTQQNKLNTIRREANAKANAEAQKALYQRLKTEDEKIALFEQEQLGGKAKTLQQELMIEQDISKMRLVQLHNELKARKISQEQYAKEVLAIGQGLSKKEAELAVETASKEIEAYRQGFQKQLEERLFLSDEVAKNKKKELDDLLEKEEKFALLKLEKGLINQDESDRQINELTEANRLAKKEIDTEREAVEKQEALELRSLEFEEELARLLEEGATRFEIQQAQTEEQFAVKKDALDASLKNQEISQELYTARLAQLQRERTDAEIQNEKTLAKEKLELATGLLDAASKVIDKDSKAGKAIALAKAGINMYQGISAGVALGFPAAIPAVAFATVTGLKAIKDIVSTKVPSARGSGSVGGGGGGFSANLATNLTGQGVNLSSSSNANIQDQVENNANLGSMTEQIANAVQQGAQAGTQQGSQEGLTNLSANQQIMQQSSF